MSEQDAAPTSILPRVSENSELEISFKLTLQDGTLVDQTEEGELLHFRIGDGQLLHNLESLLVGLEKGTKGKFVLPPEEAFGVRDSANFQTLSKQEFPDDMLLEPGFVIGFDTPTGDQIPGTIESVTEDSVVVDFNHPLSGQMVVFEAKIERIFS